MWNCFFNFRFYSKIMPTLLMTTPSEITHCGGEETGDRTCHFKEPSIQSHFIIRQMHIFICSAQVNSMQVISRLCSPYPSSSSRHQDLLSQSSPVKKPKKRRSGIAAHMNGAYSIDELLHASSRCLNTACKPDITPVLVVK